MTGLTEKLFTAAPDAVFSMHDLAAIIPGSSDALYAQVKRAKAAGEIIRIHRGLYCLARQYRKHEIHPYALAQRLYGPSYVSLESALSFHGLIPEGVFIITCTSLKKSKHISTPVGEFSFTHVPQEILLCGVERIADQFGDAFFMASPLKALADYVYVRKPRWKNIASLLESLRIEKEVLQKIKPGEAEALLDNYSNSRVKQFILGIRELL